MFVDLNVVLTDLTLVYVKGLHVFWFARQTTYCLIRMFRTKSRCL